MRRGEIAVTSPYPRGTLFRSFLVRRASSKTHFPSQGGAKGSGPGSLFQPREKSLARTSQVTLFINPGVFPNVTRDHHPRNVKYAGRNCATMRYVKYARPLLTEIKVIYPLHSCNIADITVQQRTCAVISRKIREKCINLQCRKMKFPTRASFKGGQPPALRKKLLLSLYPAFRSLPSRSLCSRRQESFS